MQNQLVKDSRNLVLTDTNPACAPPPSPTLSHRHVPLCPLLGLTERVNTLTDLYSGYQAGYWSSTLDLEKLNFKSSPFFNQFSFQTVIKPDILINLDQLTSIHFLHTKRNTLEIK